MKNPEVIQEIINCRNNDSIISEKLLECFHKVIDKYFKRHTIFLYNIVGGISELDLRKYIIERLSKSSMQFNESKSSNPLSYFNVIVSCSVTRELNIYKKRKVLENDESK